MGIDFSLLWNKSHCKLSDNRIYSLLAITFTLSFLSTVVVANQTPSQKKGQVAISHVKSVQSDKLQNHVLQSRDSLFAISRLTSESFLLVGNTGLAAIASNERVVNKLKLPTSINLLSAHTTQSAHVLVGGEQGRLFISDKSIKQWKTLNLDTEEAIFDFIESPTREVFLTGTYGLLMVSKPPYAEWKSIQLPWATFLKSAWDDFGEADPHLYSGCQNELGEMLVVGEFGLVLKRGLDGVWQKIHGGSVEPAIYSCVISPDGQEIVVVGQKGLSLSTSDGGVTWIKSEISSDADLYKIQKFNGGSIIIGDHRALHVSLNDSDWFCLRFTRDMPLGWFVDAVIADKRVVIVGSNGGFKSTTLKSITKAANEIKESGEFVSCE
ncbi:MAG TPA: hypothetical protein EYG48_06390 [Methylococcales bacterium]|jgi:photosystem II stability/assembly factor-like uncharacterized protein|nr:hypothetical protein [Methylococcales bacterium]